MSEVAPISAGRIDRLDIGSSPGRSAPRTQDAPIRPGDQVEVSTMASYLSKLRHMPVRQQLINDVRDQIARGVYETPEKIDAAINELLPEL